MKALSTKTLILIAIALPAVAMICIMLWMRLPMLGVQPKHDFVYVKGPLTYRVEGVKIVKSQSRSGRQAESYPQLYVYDVSTHASREISFEDAEKLTLSRVASDKFFVRSGKKTEGFIPFFNKTETDYTKRYLEKDNTVISLKLELTGNSNSNFSLIGWIQ